MGIPRIDTGPMTIAEFYAFTDTRPDEEHWELIEGEPVQGERRTYAHQKILGNVTYFVHVFQRDERTWEVLPGFGLRISTISRPQPDVVIRPKNAPYGDMMSRDCDDAIVIFEVLSSESANRDLRWKRKAYASLPSVAAYVVIAQDSVEVVAFERETGFAERRLESVRAVLDLPVVGVTLPLADIYRDTGLDKN